MTGLEKRTITQLFCYIQAFIELCFPLGAFFPQWGAFKENQTVVCKQSLGHRRFFHTKTTLQSKHAKNSLWRGEGRQPTPPLGTGLSAQLAGRGVTLLWEVRVTDSYK